MYRDSRKDAITWNQILRKMLKTKRITIPIPSQVTSIYDGVLHYVKNQVKQAWKKLNEIKRKQRLPTQSRLPTRTNQEKYR
jgi:hypothetical protein